MEEARTVLAAARAHGMELRLHAEQFRPGTGAALAAELHARTADHLETVTTETLDALRAAQVQPRAGAEDEVPDMQRKLAARAAAPGRN